MSEYIDPEDPWGQASQPAAMPSPALARQAHGRRRCTRTRSPGPWPAAVLRLPSPARAGHVQHAVGL